MDAKTVLLGLFTEERYTIFDEVLDIEIEKEYIMNYQNLIINTL